MNKFLAVTILMLFAAPFTVLAGRSKVAPTVLTKAADGSWTYEKIIDLPGISKDELYNRIHSWVITNIKTDDKNALTDDPLKQTITTTPTLALSSERIKYSQQVLNFKLTIQFKEGKIRILANSFTYAGILNDSNDPHNDALENLTLQNWWATRVGLDIDDAFTAFIGKAETVAKTKAGTDW